MLYSRSIMTEALSPLQEALFYFYSDFFHSFSFYFPRIIAALLLFIFGLAFARFLRSLVKKSLGIFKLNELLKDTPVDHFFRHTELKTIERIVASFAYWFVLLLILHSALVILGLSSLTSLLERLFLYLPRVFSALVILFVGLLLAGLAENTVKAVARSLQPKSARLLGVIASSLITVVAMLIAISELGIASEFIRILFLGLVAAFTLALGLAFGLGGKKLVEEMLDDWYKGFKQKRS